MTEASRRHARRITAANPRLLGLMVYVLLSLTARAQVLSHGPEEIESKPLSSWPSYAHGEVRETVSNGDYLFTSCGLGGLSVIDCRIPAAPVVLPGLTGLGCTQGLAVYHDYLLVASADAGLHIVRISDPSACSLAATFKPLGSVRWVRVVGDTAFLAHSLACGIGWFGVEVIDLTNPLSPRHIGQCPIEDGGYDYPYDLQIQGQYAYFVAYNSVRILDISNLAQPKQVAAVPVQNASRIMVDQQRAYVALSVTSPGDITIQSLDITNPRSPELLASYHSTVITGTADFRLKDGLLFILDRLGRLEIADPRDQTLLSRVAPGSYGSRTLALVGENAFVVGRNVQVIDCSEVTLPRQLCTFLFTPFYKHIELCGDHAYVLDEKGHVTIFDVSDPLAPKPSTYNPFTSIPSSIADMYVDGRMAFAVGYGLYVLNLDDPARPVVVSTNALDISLNHVVAKSGKVYATSARWENGAYRNDLVLIDAANPHNPSIIGSCLIPQEQTIYGLSVYETNCYVAAGTSLHVFTTGDSWVPTYVTNLQSLQSYSPPLFVGKQGFKLDSFKGLSIFDVVSSKTVREVTNIVLGYNCFNFDISNDLAFIGRTVFGEISVVDLRDYLSPVCAGYSRLDAEDVTDVTVNRATLGVACGLGGFSLVENVWRHYTPLIERQPVSTNASTGSTVAFKTFASGTKPITYKWQRNGLPLSEGDKYSGVNSPLLNISNVIPADEGLYSVTASNAYGEDTSTESSLRVVFPPCVIEWYGLSATGTFYIRTKTESGKTYRLETSKDLLTWEEVSTLIGTGLVASFGEMTTKDSDFRFYRVKNP